MPRLNVVDPASASGPVKEIFDGPLKGKHLNIFKGMGNSPAALNFYLAGSGALKDASLSSKEQEVVQLVFAQGNGCDYCQAAHTHIGKGAGLSEEQTVAARTADSERAVMVRVSVWPTALETRREGGVRRPRSRVSKSLRFRAEFWLWWMSRAPLKPSLPGPALRGSTAPHVAAG